MDLAVKIGKQIFPNPVTVASGTFKYIDKYTDVRKLRGLGALVPKSVTLEARQGNPSPRIVETPAGMINAIGLENDGIDLFIERELPKLRTVGVPLIVSVSADTDKGFVALVKRLEQAEVNAVELNLSCPNLGHKTLIAQDQRAVARVVGKVKKAAKIPVIAKLSPNVTDISLTAKSAESAGADAVCLVNTFAAMDIDIEKRMPTLGNVTGGLSGPAIRPIALNMVYQTAKAVKVPVIGMGGIMTAEDAVKFLIAGATMVAVGTASFVNPNAAVEILDGIKSYMMRRGLNDINQVIGSIGG